MKCNECENICKDQFLEFKALVKGGTEIKVFRRLCYNCLKKFLLELFLDELKNGHVDDILKNHGLKIVSIEQ